MKRLLCWKRAGKWAISVLIVVTAPIWGIPVLFAALLYDGVKSMHKRLWE